MELMRGSLKAGDAPQGSPDGGGGMASSLSSHPPSPSSSSMGHPTGQVSGVGPSGLRNRD